MPRIIRINILEPQVSWLLKYITYTPADSPYGLIVSLYLATSTIINCTMNLCTHTRNSRKTGAKCPLSGINNISICCYGYSHCIALVWYVLGPTVTSTLPQNSNLVKRNESHFPYTGVVQLYTTVENSSEIFLLAMYAL